MQGNPKWNYVLPMNSKQDWELYHKSSQQTAEHPYHAHEFYEFYFFISGDVSVYIDDTCYDMKKNDVIIFPPGKSHRAVFHEMGTYYERLVVYVSQKAIKRMDFESFSLKSRVDEFIEKGNIYRNISDNDFASCTKIVDCVAENAYGFSPYQYQLNRCLVETLLILLCQCFDRPDDEQSLRSQKRILSVVQYINNHLLEDLSLDSISTQFYLNKYHLSRQFKQHTNQTVYQYILSKRIQRSKELMQTGIYPTHVFNRCGFKDYSCFYKMFKKETNMSPKEYFREVNGNEGA